MVRRRPGREREGSRPAPTHRGPRPQRGEGPGLLHHYQGVEILGRLLARAGASVDPRGAIERFAGAVRDGQAASTVIPTLFPAEPRFAGPEEALALYGNLLGAWDLLEDGVDPAELLASRPPEPEPPVEEAEEEGDGEAEEPPIEAPARGSIEGRELPPEFVDTAWRWLDALPNREKVRVRDRYENAQPDLAEWTRSAGLPGVAQDVLERLIFELSEFFDRAFGDRYGLVKFRVLAAADANEGRRLQPAVAAYLDESLAEVEADEEAPIEPGVRDELERRALRALAAMSAAVVPNPAP